MIFDDGVKIDKSKLKRGAKSVDAHIFIRNDLWENLAEIQANMEDFNGEYKSWKRSELVNIAIYFFCESLNLQKCDDGKIAIILDAHERYEKNILRWFKQ